MKRTPLAETISLIAHAAGPVTAVATSLAAPLAQAATGDLDPSFADHGRLADILGAEGAVYALESRADGSALIGGGDADFYGAYYCWYYCDFLASSFARVIGEDGVIDDSYLAPAPDQVQAYGFARQGDGKVIAVGRRVDRQNGDGELVAFRLATDGSLDDTFGTDGTFTWVNPSGRTSEARSLVIDPDGRIIIAGARHRLVGFDTITELVVLRLLPDGNLDPSFGGDGIYVGPDVAYNDQSLIARTPAGSYRVAVTQAEGCRIIGLDANGALDGAFGNGGIAALSSSGGDFSACNSLEALADGSLLVSGSAGEHAFAARLLANGAPDPAFTADPAVAGSMTEATAIRSAAGGKILVAGTGIKGASIMRLQATGALDGFFGDGGQTWLDLPAPNGSAPIVNDIAVSDNGSVLAGGGDQWYDRPFVVRLLGDGGGTSAGVLGFFDSASIQESEGQAHIHVRRSGGSDGTVSVHYHTVADGDAVADQDYSSASGTLHWADGDRSEQEIVVPVAQDGGSPEGYESFAVVLDGIEGGAGLGSQYGSVTIQPDGAPAGQIRMAWSENPARESDGAQVVVSRDYYSEGEVSVTLSVESQSATAGVDFDDEPVTLTWGPGEAGEKSVRIHTVDDSIQEEAESFRVVLSNPTGGAILGPATSLSIVIPANDAPRQSHGRGGGGAAGILSLLLLGLADAFGAARRRLRNRV
jgi:uncharacterized delta-60 repeat protein